jgi:glycosyltransferase involved in cell wall biosynthesis
MSTSERTRVLIPISEPIGGQMSAVGIRKLEIGKALAPHCDVTFGVSETENDDVPGAKLAACRNRREFRGLLSRHDVLYTLGLTSDRFLDVARSGIRVVLDMYTPLAIEILESWPEMPTALLERMHRRITRWTIAQLGLADFTVCAGEAQRDMWIGTLNAAGLLDAAAARAEPDVRNLIDVVPMGVPEGQPTAHGRPLRDRLPEHCRDDFLLLWSSKILAWQDPLTLLEAMQILRHEEPRIRLVVLGIGQPPSASGRSLVDPAALRTHEALDAARTLGLIDKTVFFITERVPYRDIGACYRDADAAVATYPASLETHYCLGSRLLDFVWAGLPMVVSGGALQRELVNDQGLGLVVAPGDAAGLARKIRELKRGVEAGAFPQARFDAARTWLRWPILAEPIIEYCQTPYARTRKPRRRLARAHAQWIEFLFRSVACRISSFNYKFGEPL